MKGAGIGITEIDPDEITIDGTKYSKDSDSAFTYQIKAGVSYLMT